MNRIKFFKEGVRNLRTTGTVVRSSKALCRRLLRPIDFDKARLIVELGAGDGVITREILARMHPDALLLSFEIQPAFCEVLKHINDQRLRVIEDSAERIPQYLAEHHATQADYIVSSLPFSIFPKELRDNIIDTSKRHLDPHGCFVQYHYSLVLKSYYDEVFKEVKMNFVPLNVPPAFIFTCTI